MGYCLLVVANPSQNPEYDLPGGLNQLALCCWDLTTRTQKFSVNIEILANRELDIDQCRLKFTEDQKHVWVHDGVGSLLVFGSNDGNKTSTIPVTAVSHIISRGDLLVTYAAGEGLVTYSIYGEKLNCKQVENLEWCYENYVFVCLKAHRDILVAEVEHFKAIEVYGLHDGNLKYRRAVNPNFKPWTAIPL